MFRLSRLLQVYGEAGREWDLYRIFTGMQGRVDCKHGRGENKGVVWPGESVVAWNLNSVPWRDGADSGGPKITIVIHQGSTYYTFTPDIVIIFLNKSNCIMVCSTWVVGYYSWIRPTISTQRWCQKCDFSRKGWTCSDHPVMQPPCCFRVVNGIVLLQAFLHLIVIPIT